jgi:hypothetical protein
MALDGDVQSVTAYQTTRRVNQHVVAHRFALRIQALQYAQWPAVNVAGDGAPCFLPIIDIQLGTPNH